MKENGKNFTLKWDDKIIAEGVDVTIEGDEMPDVDNTPDDYDYLFVIADLILELHLDEMVKPEIPTWCWTNIINAMIEFKKATDGIGE